MKRNKVMPEEGTFYMPRPWVPVLPFLGLLALMAVIWANWKDPAIGRPSILASIGEILLGLGYWFIRRKVFKADVLLTQ